MGSTVSGKLTNCIEVLATGALGKDVRQGRESQIVHFLVPDSLLSLVFFSAKLIGDQYSAVTTFPASLSNLDRASAKIAEDTLTHQEGSQKRATERLRERVSV